MKVLIVDQDKKFSEAMSDFLSECRSDLIVDVYNDKQEFEQILKEDSVSYDIGFVDADLIENDVSEVYKKSPSCKLIAFTSNNKNLTKIINNPLYYRIFHKPINISDISNYLKIQKKIKSNQKYLIDSSKCALYKLIDLGFNPIHSGTLYLAESVYYAIMNRTHKLKSIYKEISKELKVSSEQINWSINYAINQVNDSKSLDRLSRFFCIHDNRKVTARVIVDFFITNN